jgi:hypothetical protein
MSEPNGAAWWKSIIKPEWKEIKTGAEVTLAIWFLLFVYCVFQASYDNFQKTYGERQQSVSTNTQLQNKLEESTKPKLEVIICQIRATYFPKDHQETIVLVQMGILNKGVDSSVTSYKAHYRSSTLDQDMPIRFLPAKEQTKAFPQERETEDGDIQNIQTVTQSPIRRGAIMPGKLFVELPGNRMEELKKDAVLTITVQDYLGTEASGQFPNSNKLAGVLPFHAVHNAQTIVRADQ